jgi:hypothetical protein
MSTHQQAHPLSRNRLLASLPSEELTALQPYMEQVSLSHGQSIIYIQPLLSVHKLLLVTVFIR